LSDPQDIAKVMNEAATEMKATIVESRFHHFSPLGVSGVIIIMESHLTIHTWPEYGYAAVDVFTCGEIDLDAGINYLKEHLLAKKTELKKLNRGLAEKFVTKEVSK
jgi:S-adenosylmethionine decarboxylase